jgi:hypothetical protein
VSAIVGTWDLKLKTPIGTIAVVYNFTESAGALAGTASSEDETVRLTGIESRETAGGQRVTWRQSVSKPTRLNLEFEVLAAMDTLTGTARAGKFLSSKVTGIRRRN